MLPGSWMLAVARKRLSRPPVIRMRPDVAIVVAWPAETVVRKAWDKRSSAGETMVIGSSASAFCLISAERGVLDSPGKIPDTRIVAADSNHLLVQYRFAAPMRRSLKVLRIAGSEGGKEFPELSVCGRMCSSSF